MSWETAYKWGEGWDACAPKQGTPKGARSPFFFWEELHQSAAESLQIGFLCFGWMLPIL